MQYYLIAGEETELNNPATVNPQIYYATVDMAVPNATYPGVMGELVGASFGQVVATQLTSYSNQNSHSGSIHNEEDQEQAALNYITLNCIMTGRKAAQMDASEENIIRSIAESGTAAARQAQGINTHRD